MVEARQQSDWNHTANLMAMMANTAMSTNKNRKVFHPKEFHPYSRATPKPKMSKAQIKERMLSFVGVIPKDG